MADFVALHRTGAAAIDRLLKQGGHNRAELLAAIRRQEYLLGYIRCAISQRVRVAPNRNMGLIAEAVEVSSIGALPIHHPHSMDAQLPLTTTTEEDEEAVASPEEGAEWAQINAELDEMDHDPYLRTLEHEAMQHKGFIRVRAVANLRACVLKCVVPGCNARFPRKSSLKQHYKRHIALRSNPCPVPTCGQGFTTRLGLGHHLQREHPDFVKDLNSAHTEVIPPTGE